MKNIKVIISFIMLTSFLFAQGWNTAVTTSISPNAVVAADNFANRSGIHVLTIGGSSDSPSYNVKYHLLSSSGSIVRSYSFETGGSYPSIAGDNDNIYVAY